MSQALVVDDDPSFRTLVADLLPRAAWSVTFASSGAGADVEVERTIFDLVVVEGALADVDGVSWIASLRHRGRTPRVLVFVSSLWRDAATVEKLTRELGVALVVFKPVTADAFGTQLLPLLDPPPSRSVSRAALQALAKEAMVSLAAEYALEVPGKVAELERAVHAVGAGSDDATLERARSLAHRLGGTAGSYGFAEIGEHAGRIEHALPRLRQIDPAERARVWTTLERDLAELGAAVSALASARRGQP